MERVHLDGESISLTRWCGAAMGTILRQEPWVHCLALLDFCHEQAPCIPWVQPLKNTGGFELISETLYLILQLIKIPQQFHVESFQKLENEIMHLFFSFTGFRAIFSGKSISEMKTLQAPDLERLLMRKQEACSLGPLDSASETWKPPKS